jgi:hypothetical protein
MIEDDEDHLMDIRIDGIRARHGTPKPSPRQLQIDADRRRLGLPPVR